MVDQELYSIRMRAAIGGRHELGGKHISGGEQLASKSDIIAKSTILLEKALKHNRGEPDFLQVTIEKVEQPINLIPPLPVHTYEVTDEHAGRQLAKSFLSNAGINEDIINQGIRELENSFDTRGAIIIDVNTGKRVDSRGLKGVRVSRIDWDIASYQECLGNNIQPPSIKIKEALALATKVTSHPSTVAELCWSDDPDYITGYVATLKQGYQRITKLKKFGDATGGRIYFVQLPCNEEIDSYISFLEKVPTILKLRSSEGVNSLVEAEKFLVK